MQTVKKPTILKPIHFFEKDGTLKTERLQIRPNTKFQSKYGQIIDLSWKFDWGIEEIYILLEDTPECRLYSKIDASREYSEKPVCTVSLTTSPDSPHVKLLKFIEQRVLEFVKDQSIIYGKKNRMISSVCPFVENTELDPIIKNVKINFVKSISGDSNRKSKLPSGTIITRRYSSRGIRILDWDFYSKKYKLRTQFKDEEDSIVKEFNAMEKRIYTLDNINEYISRNRIFKKVGFVVESVWVGSEKLSLRLIARDIYYTSEYVGNDAIVDDENEEQVKELFQKFVIDKR